MQRRIPPSCHGRGPTRGDGCGGDPIDDETIELDPQGRFSVERTLQAGSNQVHVVARNPQGFSRIVRLDVAVSKRDAAGKRITVVPGVPNLTLRLPPEGVQLRTPRLTLVGSTDPGNQVRVNGTAFEVRCSPRSRSSRRRGTIPTG